MSFTARAAKPARNSSDKVSEEERRKEKERAEPSSRGTHPLPAATAPVTCRTLGLLNPTTQLQKCTRGGKNQTDGESPWKRAGDRGRQRMEDGFVRGAGCRECGVPGLPAGARRGEDGR